MAPCRRRYRRCTAGRRAARPRSSQAWQPARARREPLPISAPQPRAGARARAQGPRRRPGGAAGPRIWPTANPPLASGRQPGAPRRSPRHLGAISRAPRGGLGACGGSEERAGAAIAAPDRAGGPSCGAGARARERAGSGWRRCSDGGRGTCLKAGARAAVARGKLGPSATSARVARGVSQRRNVGGVRACGDALAAWLLSVVLDGLGLERTLLSEEGDSRACSTRRRAQRPAGVRSSRSHLRSCRAHPYSSGCAGLRSEEHVGVPSHPPG